MGDEPGNDDDTRGFAGEVVIEEIGEETASRYWEGFRSPAKCGEVYRNVRGGSWVEEGVLDATEEREGVW